MRRRGEARKRRAGAEEDEMEEVVAPPEVDSGR
jgi:hypothetical protein